MKCFCEMENVKIHSIHKSMPENKIVWFVSKHIADLGRGLLLLACSSPTHYYYYNFRIMKMRRKVSNKCDQVTYRETDD